MKYPILTYLSALISLFIIPFNSFASNPAKPTNSVQAKELMHQKKSLFFEENKGQLLDENRNPIADVQYYGHSNGVYLYCKQGIISFVFTKVENDGKISEATGTTKDQSTLSPAGGGRGWKNSEIPHPSKITTSRMDLVLIGSNPNVQITATDLQEYYENFFTTGDADQGITHAHTYKTVTYKNIYPYIDMILRANGLGMEYSFIVHPGGKVSDIKLKWDGIDDSKTLADGGLKFSNALGSLEERAPESFQDGKGVKSFFLNEEGHYGFKMEDYDKSKDLLIDPDLIWATYFGGINADVSQGISMDVSGNIFITGGTFSSNNIATTGSYQTTYEGQQDVFIAKFSTSGTPSWATYYGGSGGEAGYAISTDPYGNAYVTGYTIASSTGIATSGAYQTSNGGYYDCFLAKFTSSGSLNWGTYYGGHDDNHGYAVCTDDSGNAYITGITSTSGLATSGAYQTSFVGSQDGFLTKFSSTGAVLWATYYGGVGYGVCTDTTGNVYITGGGGIATSGAYQTSIAGYNDANLAKFSSSGNLTWATYYGGNDGDIGQAVCTDASGNIYLTGYTLSSNGIATSGAYQTFYEGNVDAFLAKFSSSGSLSWGTYYGEGIKEFGQGICTDALGNVLITGATNSSTGMATSGSYQTSNAGGYDAFLSKFSSSGSLIFGTYYGGSDDDGSCGVSTDVSGNAYITGNTTGSSGIATSGAYQTSYGGGGEDGFLARFNFPYQNDAGIDTIENPSGAICAGTQPLKVQLHNFGSDTLTSVKIGLSINDTARSTYSWTGSLAPGSSTIIILDSVFTFKPGSYKLITYTSEPNGIKDSVPGNDTMKLNFTVNSLPVASVIPDTAICSGTFISIGTKAVTGSSYSWASSPSGIHSNSANPSVSPTTNNIYILTEINANGCIKSDSVTITVNALPAAAVVSDTGICFGNTISIGATAVSGSKYSWTSSPSGFSSTSSNPSVSPASKTSYILTETNLNGCIKSDSTIIVVNALRRHTSYQAPPFVPGKPYISEREG